jgi:hypothetical protein
MPCEIPQQLYSQTKLSPFYDVDPCRAYARYLVTARKIVGSGSPAGDLLLTMAIFEDPALGPTVLHFAIPWHDEHVSVYRQFFRCQSLSRPGFRHRGSIKYSTSVGAAQEPGKGPSEPSLARAIGQLWRLHISQKKSSMLYTL